MGRRAIPNLPDSAQELIIDFDNISALKIPKLETVYLSLGYPLYYQNVLGVMNSTLKENFFKVDFTYQLQIAEKAKEAGAKNIVLISAAGANPDSWNYYLKTKGKIEME